MMLPLPTMSQEHLAVKPLQEKYLQVQTPAVVLIVWFRKHLNEYFKCTTALCWARTTGGSFQTGSFYHNKLQALEDVDCNGNLDNMFTIAGTSQYGAK